MNVYSLVGMAVLGGLALAAAGDAGSAAAARPIRVVVWDEQQPVQKEAYPNFLGNAIADYLRDRTSPRDGRPIQVRSVRLDDPEQGLSREVLDHCDVLLWWGHVRHGEIKPETGRALVQRIKQGKLSLIALHSAHWSTPFIEAMNERATQDALKKLTRAEREKVEIRYVQPQKRLYRKDEPLTPSSWKTVRPDGTVLLEIRLPSCVFPAVRNDGKPSHVRTLLPGHPIAEGVPGRFDIPRTEMYDAPFHVPTPDAVVFEERWDAGEQFPAGCVWNLGKGKVFYFRPGHETYPIFMQPEVQRVLENAVRWLAD
jgi:trehalose utilization protein